MTTALSPPSRMSIMMIWPSATQKSGDDISIRHYTLACGILKRYGLGGAPGGRWMRSKGMSQLASTIGPVLWVATPHTDPSA